MESFSEKDIREIVSGLKRLMDEKKAELIQLDSAMGDGDLGLTMSAAFTKAAEELAAYEETNINKILLKTGMVIAKAAPSTMGTLVATGFMRAGKALPEKSEIGLAEVASLFNGFAQGIAERGKSKPGEKTILDSLHPASSALEGAVKANLGLKEGLERAYAAAQKGVESTKAMTAQHGRAAYYGEKSVGKQDPGATVGMYILQVFRDQAR